MDMAFSFFPFSEEREVISVVKQRVYCTCKKSRCLKKYCVCFANNIPCDPSKCHCTNCGIPAAAEVVRIPIPPVKRKVASLDGYLTPDNKRKRQGGDEILQPPVVAVDSDRLLYDPYEVDCFEDDIYSSHVPVFVKFN